LSDWWTPTVEADHEQGDLLRSLAVVHVDELTLGADEQVQAHVRVIDAIVLTQTCDLRNSSVDSILVARVVSWEDFAAAQFAAGNTAVKGSSFRRNLIRGDIPPLALLHERRDEPALPWSIVDFRSVHTIDRRRLDAFTSETSVPRLRLVPPYKEHLAQAFARFHMRVGLPHDARSFEEAGGAAVQHLGASAP
jgi:hypothetical protein